MHTDVVDLRDFYETRLGQVARHMIRRGIRAMWPELTGMSLLGLGLYAVIHYLEKRFTRYQGREDE